MTSTMGPVNYVRSGREMYFQHNISAVDSSTDHSQVTLTGYIFDEKLIAQFDFFFNCFFLHFLSLIGVVTNILNIFVLWRHSFSETTTIWLLSMSVTDLITSVVHPLRRINCIVDQFDPVAGLTSRAVSVVYLVNIPDIFISASMFITTAIAVERLVAVLLPLKVSQIFTPSRVIWTIALLYAYTVIMLGPTWFFLSYIIIFDPIYNVTRGGYMLSQFYASDYENLTKYATGSLTQLFTSVTFITIVTCSVILSIKLTISRSKTLAKMTSWKSGSRQVRDMKVVKMLLTVCLVNAGISIPTVTIQFFLLYSNLSILSAGKFHYLLRSIVSILYQVNADVNFFIYVTVSTKFAKTLRTMLHCFRLRPSFNIAKADVHGMEMEE
ncbi:neuropeptide FF receptor 2 [Biomphalaria glabrata]|nr:neuropeptide FF receptor 2 [Biomphalaria glabrata]